MAENEERAFPKASDDARLVAAQLKACFDALDSMIIKFKQWSDPLQKQSTEEIARIAEVGSRQVAYAERSSKWSMAISLLGASASVSAAVVAWAVFLAS